MHRTFLLKIETKNLLINIIFRPKLNWESGEILQIQDNFVVTFCYLLMIMMINYGNVMNFTSLSGEKSSIEKVKKMLHMLLNSEI